MEILNSTISTKPRTFPTLSIFPAKTYTPSRRIQSPSILLVPSSAKFLLHPPFPLFSPLRFRVSAHFRPKRNRRNYLKRKLGHELPKPQQVSQNKTTISDSTYDSNAISVQKLDENDVSDMKFDGITEKRSSLDAIKFDVSGSVIGSESQSETKSLGDPVMWHKLENWVEQYKKEAELWGIGTGPIFTIYEDSVGKVERVIVDENEILRRSRKEPLFANDHENKDSAQLNSKVNYARALARDMESGTRVPSRNSTVTKFVTSRKSSGGFSEAIRSVSVNPYLRPKISGAGILLLSGCFMIWMAKRVIGPRDGEHGLSRLEKEMLRRKIRARGERMKNVKGSLEVINGSPELQILPSEKPSIDEEELMDDIMRAVTLSDKPELQGSSNILDAPAELESKIQEIRAMARHARELENRNTLPDSQGEEDEHAIGEFSADHEETGQQQSMSSRSDIEDRFVGHARDFTLSPENSTVSHKSDCLKNIHIEASSKDDGLISSKTSNITVSNAAEITRDQASIPVIGGSTLNRTTLKEHYDIQTSQSSTLGNVSSTEDYRTISYQAKHTDGSAAQYMSYSLVVNRLPSDNLKDDSGGFNDEKFMMQDTVQIGETLCKNVPSDTTGFQEKARDPRDISDSVTALEMGSSSNILCSQSSMPSKMDAHEKDVLEEHLDDSLHARTAVHSELGAKAPGETMHSKVFDDKRDDIGVSLSETSRDEIGVVNSSVGNFGRASSVDSTERNIGSDTSSRKSSEPRENHRMKGLRLIRSVNEARGYLSKKHKKLNASQKLTENPSQQVSSIPTNSDKSETDGDQSLQAYEHSGNLNHLTLTKAPDSPASSKDATSKRNKFMQLDKCNSAITQGNERRQTIDPSSSLLCNGNAISQVTGPTVVVLTGEQKIDDEATIEPEKSAISQPSTASDSPTVSLGDDTRFTNNAENTVDDIVGENLNDMQKIIIDPAEGDKKMTDLSPSIKREDWMEKKLTQLRPIVEKIQEGFQNNFMEAMQESSNGSMSETEILPLLDSGHSELEWMKDERLRDIVFKVRENELEGRDPFYQMDDEDKLAFFAGLEKKVEQENHNLLNLHKWIHSNVENLDYGAGGISLYDPPERVIPRWKGPPLGDIPEFISKSKQKKAVDEKTIISGRRSKTKQDLTPKLKETQIGNDNKIYPASAQDMDHQNASTETSKTIIEGSDGSIKAGKKSGKEYWQHTKKWSREFLECYNAETDPEVKGIMKDMGKDLDRWITEEEMQGTANLMDRLSSRNQKYIKEKLDRVKRELQQFGPRAVVSKYREYADEKEEDHLWWLDLPYILCIELYTKEDEEAKVGFYSLQMAADLELDPKQYHVIAFEDAGDCKNLCHIIQAHMDMLGNGKAFVIAQPPKDAFREAKANGFNVTVIRKGEIKLNVDQKLEEVEELISEIGSKMYHDKIMREHSIGLNAVMKGLIGPREPKKRKRSKRKLKRPSKG